ncbi:MAG: four-carbon acid sugar kinase family protein [Fusobacteriaceae bacterium]|jgi:uncharacterized protein YgbK (DUF1537 family)|nr:four-carbon acid sugar kinase family protein [Fusobacteriaceae bacterium]
MENKILFGCLADDFTGASDAASFLTENGTRVILYNGIPDKNGIIEPNCQSVVIALKTRTEEKNMAVSQSLKAAKWLKNHGAKKLYVKYCSTFDSTKDGNIGPIVDAILEEYNVPYTILCPALPVNKRIVKDGKLYVDGVLLHESPMSNHPLTPMWASEIKILIEAQSKYRAFNLEMDELFGEKEKLFSKLKDLSRENKHFYLIPDYHETEHGEKIIDLFGDLPLLTGGSGLMSHIAKKFFNICEKTQNNPVEDKIQSGAVILAGSCSVATLSQIADYQKKGGKSYQIYPLKLMYGEQKLEDIISLMQSSDNLLIYSSAPSDEVKKVQANGKEKIAQMLEQAMATIAAAAIECGKYRIIVAGGETSGTITQKLGFKSYLIGKSIAPGVPIMTPLKNNKIRLVLKSGNFGQEDFFTRALEMTGGQN